MLVQFKVSNFRCFKDEACLSLVASNYYKDNKESLCDARWYSVLPVAALFGANASGKTKLLDAIARMRYWVVKSAVSDLEEKIPVEPFMLNTATVSEPTFFEIVILHNDVQYRYGFRATKEKIVEEWLYRKDVQEVQLFHRAGNDIDFNHRYHHNASKLVEGGMVREKSLFLSVLAQWNDRYSGDVVEEVKKLLFMKTNEGEFKQYAAQSLGTDKKERMISMLKGADMGIFDMKPMQNSDIMTLHHVYDANHLITDSIAPFSLTADESNGTQQFIILSAPVIRALEEGDTLIIDELDESLHTDLVSAIVRLFADEKTNPHHAQLIFNTQDTNILDDESLRRDEFYLVDKNAYGESSLSSIGDFKMRSANNLEMQYLKGRFGAKPNLTQFAEEAAKYESKSKKETETKPE